jgi:hypothetical protein
LVQDGELEENIGKKLKILLYRSGIKHSDKLNSLEITGG